MRATVFPTMVSGCWGWEVKKDRCFADPITASYFGLTPTEGAMGLPVKRYLAGIHTEDRERVEQRIAEAVHDGSAFCEEYRVNTLGGETRYITASGRCFHDAMGEPEFYPGYIVDMGCQPGDESAFDMGGMIALAKLGARRSGNPFLQYLLEMADLEYTSTMRRREKPM